jgi:glucose/arabinose dehydrogenase
VENKDHGSGSPKSQETLDKGEVLSTPSGPINVESLAKLDNPWALAFLPDGRLLITEKPGQLRVYAGGKLSEPIGGVPKVEYHEQGGLLEVTVDHDFAKSQLVYLSYTERAAEQPAAAMDEGDPRLGEFQDLNDVVLKGLAVARGRLEGDRLLDLKVIWRQSPKTIGRGHFGGRLAFAPDGSLFITSGDRQRFDPAQDLGSTLGKVVRINPDGSIPDDNPFVKEKGVRPEIWSLGHRNPLGAAIHPTSGELWISEMGPKGGDEVNIVEKGKNYGWPVVSDGDNYNDTPIPDHSTHPEFTAPIFFWNPSISPGSLAFYDGDSFPAFKGNALLGGLSSEALIVLKLAGNRAIGDEQIKMGKRIRESIQAPDGTVLLLVDGDDGELLRLTPSDRTTQC